jgi:hypothetical protein
VSAADVEMIKEKKEEGEEGAAPEKGAAKGAPAEKGAAKAAAPAAGAEKKTEKTAEKKK